MSSDATRPDPGTRVEDHETDPRHEADGPDEWSRLWTLDPAVLFLNHGSFGACPRAVLEYQQGLRARLERNPIQFFVREFEDLLDEARSALAAFVGADAGTIVLVPNATTAVNTVLHSLSLRRGDELLTTDHAYGACRNALEFAAARSGATIVVAEVPFPIHSPDEVLQSVLGKITTRTRLALLDHVTSPTGLVFPVKQLVSELAVLGVDSLVDGAHAPGMLPLEVQSIGGAYYTGNCHKWLCAPKGAAFLHVRRDKQSEIRPLAISHGSTSSRKDRSRFHLEFDWTGTDDPTAALTVPEAIRYMGSLLPGGWPELMEKNRAKALAARRVLCDQLGVPAPAPDDMIGTLAAVALPDAPPGSRITRFGTYPLQEFLAERHRIEVPIIAWPDPPRRWVRISAQLYNRAEEYETLAAALVEALSNEAA